MSRISNVPITVPKGVTVTVGDTDVKVKGPKGELAIEYHGRVTIEQKDGEISVSANPADLNEDGKPKDSQTKANLGLYYRLVLNMIIGVTEGFKKELEVQGVGYRAQMKGKKLVLNLGFSHPVEMDPPAGITFSAPSQTEIAVEGADKQMVGQLAAQIRKYRVPEPYKGKGVRYKGEYIVRKAGKSGGKK